jgi:membrane protease YdiL (CAAX protease family)
MTSRERTEGPSEGATLFHLALAFGLMPGISPWLALVGWSRLRVAEPRWAIRLAALGALDLGVLLAVMLTAGVMMTGQRGALPTGSSTAARPRIGVTVDDDPAGGAVVLSVAPGSPASDASLQEGDRITAVDGAPVAGRQALTESIAEGPLAPRSLTLTRAGEPLTLGVTPVTQPFRPVPLDAARCRGALDGESTRERLSRPATWGTLGGMIAVLAGLFVWGRRRGLPTRRSAEVLLPFVGILVLCPTLGSLLTASLCPLLLGLEVRYETVEIFCSEVLLTLSSLALLWAHRGLGPSLHDEQPRLGYLRTLAQGLLYVFAWMPRAILLSVPIAALGTFDEAPIGELLASASQTPLDGVLTFVTAAMLAPVAEECLFRGVLAPHLGRLVAPFPAILVTAAIFGVLHIGGHGPLFIGPVFLGAILGWARLRSSGLAVPITLHVILNAFAMTIALTLGVA